MSNIRVIPALLASFMVASAGGAAFANDGKSTETKPAHETHHKQSHHDKIMAKCEKEHSGDQEKITKCVEAKGNEHGKHSTDKK